jgi:hypothetical protein
LVVAASAAWPPKNMKTFKLITTSSLPTGNIVLHLAPPVCKIWVVAEHFQRYPE